MSLIGISGKLRSGKDAVAIMIQGLNMSLDRDQIIHAVKENQFFRNGGYDIKRFADPIKDTVCMWLDCSRSDLEDREFKEKPLGEEWWYHKFYLDALMEESIMIPYNGEENEYQVENRPKEYSGYTLIKLTPRKLMQLLGTDAGREIIHPDLWVNTLFSEYKPEVFSYDEEGKNPRAALKYPDWIIPDMRFPNEKQRVEDKGGITIRVERDTELRFPDLYDQFQYDSDYQDWERWLKENWKDDYDKIYHHSETALDGATGWSYEIDNNGSLDDLLQRVKSVMNQENLI